MHTKFGGQIMKSLVKESIRKSKNLEISVDNILLREKSALKD